MEVTNNEIPDSACLGCPHPTHPPECCEIEDCSCLSPNYFKGVLRDPTDPTDLADFDTGEYLSLARAIHAGYLSRAATILQNSPARDDLIQLMLILRELETAWTQIWDVVHHTVGNNLAARGYHDQNLEYAINAYARSRPALPKLSTTN